MDDLKYMYERKNEIKERLKEIYNIKYNEFQEDINDFNRISIEYIKYGTCILIYDFDITIDADYYRFMDLSSLVKECERKIDFKLINNIKRS